MQAISKRERLSGPLPREGERKEVAYHNAVEPRGTSLSETQSAPASKKDDKILEYKTRVVYKCSSGPSWFDPRILKEQKGKPARFVGRLGCFHARKEDARGVRL
jgi:hypothetical protein